jgi:hypothetical protein
MPPRRTSPWITLTPSDALELLRRIDLAERRLAVLRRGLLAPRGWRLVRYEDGTQPRVVDPFCGSETATLCGITALGVPDRGRLRKRHAPRSGKSAGASLPRRVPSS